jgi:hypothetical protein
MVGFVMAGFVTGANFVSYSAGGRDPNVGFDVPYVTTGAAADAVFASLEQHCARRPALNTSAAVTIIYSQLFAQKQ